MPSPRATVCPATAEEWPVVERLAQLERHDLSQFRGYVPRADGSYAFDGLDLFRAEPGRQPWLIRYGLTLAGFALTRPLESGGTSMYAFFIVRGLRRHGVGLQAARELLRLIPGVWGIAFQDENADAQPFWPSRHGSSCPTGAFAPEVTKARLVGLGRSPVRTETRRLRRREPDSCPGGSALQG